MPLLDPSLIVLSSPMLLDTFSVRRRHSVVVAGRQKHQDNLIEGISGVVYVSGDNSSRREEDATTGNKGIEVITQFRLQGLVEGLMQDVVIWHGEEFLVETAEDYSGFGQGWIQATCSSQEIVDKVAGG